MRHGHVDGRDGRTQHRDAVDRNPGPEIERRARQPRGELPHHVDVLSGFTLQRGARIHDADGRRRDDHAERRCVDLAIGARRHRHRPRAGRCRRIDRDIRQRGCRRNHLERIHLNACAERDLRRQIPRRERSPDGHRERLPRQADTRAQPRDHRRGRNDGQNLKTAGQNLRSGANRDGIKTERRNRADINHRRQRRAAVDHRSPHNRYARAEIDHRDARRPVRKHAADRHIQPAGSAYSRCRTHRSNGRNAAGHHKRANITEHLARGRNIEAPNAQPRGRRDLEIHRRAGGAVDDKRVDADVRAQAGHRELRQSLRPVRALTRNGHHSALPLISRGRRNRADNRGTGCHAEQTPGNDLGTRRHRDRTSAREGDRVDRDVRVGCRRVHDGQAVERDALAERRRGLARYEVRELRNDMQRGSHTLHGGYRSDAVQSRHAGSNREAVLQRGHLAQRAGGDGVEPGRRIHRGGDVQIRMRRVDHLHVGYVDAGAEIGRCHAILPVGILAGQLEAHGGTLRRGRLSLNTDDLRGSRADTELTGQAHLLGSRGQRQTAAGLLIHGGQWVHGHTERGGHRIDYRDAVDRHAARVTGLRDSVDPVREPAQHLNDLALALQAGIGSAAEQRWRALHQVEPLNDVGDFTAGGQSHGPQP